MNLLFKRVLFFLLGSAVLALGVVFAIPSNVGLGAFDALSYNGSLFYNLPIGVTMNLHIFALLIILMVFKPDKKYIVGTIISFATGLFIDLFHILFELPDLGSMNYVYFIISLSMFPLGVAAMINSGLPVGPIEELPLYLTERLKIKYLYTKTGLEVVYVLIALVYSLLAGAGVGSIMVGTLIITLYIGPGITFCRKFLPSLRAE